MHLVESHAVDHHVTAIAYRSNTRRVVLPVDRDSRDPLGLQVRSPSPGAHTPPIAQERAHHGSAHLPRRTQNQHCALHDDESYGRYSIYR